MSGTPVEQATPDYVGHDEKLPIGVKLAYGAPNFAGAAMAIPIAIHMPIFYSDVVLVPLGYIALGMAVARAFDAITDPLMGWLTDRTNTRWGRRRPWMIVGAPLCAVAFVLLFSPPVSLTSAGAGWWFAASFIGYYLFHTVYSIPHYGLGPELTLDYRERSSLFGWMEGFAVGGTLIASVAPFLLLAWLEDARLTYSAIAVTFGALLIVLYVIQCVRIKERPDFYTRKSNPIAPGLRRVFRNRPFRVLLAVYVVGSITGAIPGLMVPYFTKYVLKPENPEIWLAIFLVSYFGSGLLVLPLWVMAARRFGKKAIYLVTFANGITASACMFFLGEGQTGLTLLLMIWAGSVFGVRLFLGPAMQADVIDYDELYTGKRREAQYGAMWAFMTKFVVIPSASIPLAILATVGYVPNVEQSETVQVAIRAIFGLMPAASGVIAFVFAIFFPITEAIHDQIREGIRRHDRGESALDPLTGRHVPPPPPGQEDEDTSWFLDHFAQPELGRVLSRGVPALVGTIVAKLALSLLAMAGFGAFVAANVEDLSNRPPLLAVLAVVGAGVSLGASAYHGLRLRAALRMRRAPTPHATIRTHLELLADAYGREAPAREPLPAPGAR